MLLDCSYEQPYVMKLGNGMLNLDLQTVGKTVQYSNIAHSSVCPIECNSL